MPEPLNELLAALPEAQPDRARAERTRVRCRAKLARQAPSAPAPRIGAAFVWQPLVAMLGFAYLIDVVIQAVAALGSQF